MPTDQKMSSENRQIHILTALKKANTPITGSVFAQETNVSRQVIVQDVSILKAKGEPIIATSQGYVYMEKDSRSAKQRRVIVVKHTPEQAKEELQAIVDHGVTVYDVTVEHPVYGHLTGILNVSNRYEVDQFVEKVNETKASLLSELTAGVHLHTLEAETVEQIDTACEKLREIGLLFESEK